MYDFLKDVKIIIDSTKRIKCILLLNLKMNGTFAPLVDSFYEALWNTVHMFTFVQTYRPAKLK